MKTLDDLITISDFMNADEGYEAVVLGKGQ